MPDVEANAAGPRGGVQEGDGAVGPGRRTKRRAGLEGAGALPQPGAHVASPGDGALTTAEKEELSHLRREVKVLRMEREILKRAATFFAKENA